MFYRKLFLFLAAILSLNILSFLGYQFAWINVFVFSALLILVTYYSFKDMRWAVALVLSELCLSSMGYGFSTVVGTTPLSLRIAMWAIVMGVWGSKFLLNREWKKLPAIFKNKLNRPLCLLFISVILGLIVGAMRGNSFDNIFFDFNNWLYWLLLFPALSAFKLVGDIKRVLPLLMAAVVSLVFQSLGLLYLFSHNLLDENPIFYNWVRDTRLGEITLMSDGFYRIFIQSQVFLLPAFFLLIFYLVQSLEKKSFFKRDKIIFAFSPFLIAVLIIGLSRSFWSGLAVGWVFFVTATILSKQAVRKIIKINILLLSLAIASLGVAFAVVKFPYPKSVSDLSAGLLADRAGAVKGEAGASSRWSLLPKLGQAIAKSPVIGSGFGTTVTYKSSDPRILESSSDGSYTTYAFEWGWLDIWLKLGLVGIAAYVWLLVSLIPKVTAQSSWIDLGLSATLISLTAVNIFSPYFNHPLGIGLMIAIIAYYRAEKSLK